MDVGGRRNAREIDCWACGWPPESAVLNEAASRRGDGGPLARLGAPTSAPERLLGRDCPQGARRLGLRERGAPGCSSHSEVVATSQRAAKEPWLRGTRSPAVPAMR